MLKITKVNTTMRTLIFILILGFIPNLIKAQYFVIKVNEKVYANNQLLKPRSKISANAQLRFNSSSAFAYIMSTKDGNAQYILSPKKAKKNDKGEFILALKEALMPTGEFLAAATRSRDLIELNSFQDKYDFKAYFRGTLVLFDSTVFEVNEKKYPQNDQSYFAITQVLDNDTLLTPLPFHKNTFALHPGLFFNNEGSTPENNTIKSLLIYKDQANKKEVKLGEFRLRFLVDEEIEELKKELGILKENLPPTSTDVLLKQHLLPFLKLNYGKLRVKDIMALLE